MDRSRQRRRRRRLMVAAPEVDIKLFPALFAALFAITAVRADTQDQEPRRHRSWPIDILTETFGFDESTPSDYPWQEILQGCRQRDCIPSIDQPRFVSAGEATYLEDDDIVLAVDHRGVTRAYPTRILVFHEIVNDTIAGEPVVISYCPLCGSGLAFHRMLDGEVVEFGVSGLLHNSDLIMYDRKTESLWQQIEGSAFAGTMRGRKLEDFPMAMTTWREWRDAHPNTQVLSTDTGFEGMPYEAGSPYGDYRTNDRIMFPVSARDARLHPKRVIFGVEIEGRPIAYEAEYLKKEGKLSDSIGGLEVHVIYQADGTVRIQENNSGRRWIAHRMFWFAWYSFHPDTGLRDGNGRDRSRVDP